MSRQTLRRLVSQERDCHHLPDCLPRSPLHEGTLHNQIWRQAVVGWLYTIVDRINADREIVYMAMNIIDRFLSLQVRSSSKAAHNALIEDEKSYETVVITSFLMALKLQGINTLCLDDLVSMSRQAITTKDVVRTGKEIVSNLSWNCQIPTPARFAHALVQILPPTVHQDVKVTLFDLAIYQLELSLFDDFCSRQSPSLLAWMALENALNKVSTISKATIDTFRSEVSSITKNVANNFLRQKLLALYDSENDVSHQSSQEAPTLIPPDTDECCDQICTYPAYGEYLWRPRSLSSSTVVPNDEFESTDCTSTTSRVRCREESGNQSSLHRSKRFRGL